MNKLALVIMIPLLIALMFCGCSGSNHVDLDYEKIAAESEEPDAQTDSQIRVGFSQMENNMPWRIAETNSVKEEAEKRGIELVLTDAQSSVEKQVNDVKYLIEQDVDYILLAPRQERGLEPALAAAKEAKIPVILIDRWVTGVAGEDYVTFIGSDHAKEGRWVAEWLSKATGAQANIVELRGTDGSSSAITRKQGFEEYINLYPGMRIIASESANFTRSEGKKVMENLLQKYGDRITAVFAHNDEMAIGAIQATKAIGKTPGEDIIFVSIDGEKDALKAIIAGELGCSVECSPFFGPIAFDVVEMLERGEKVPTSIVNEDRIFDISNAELYVDEAF